MLSGARFHRGGPGIVLIAHPTPPVFDGQEDRNGCHNHDAIRFFADAIDLERSSCTRDDRGVTSGLAADQRFIVPGDDNAGTQARLASTASDHRLVSMDLEILPDTE